ncbi:DUF4440 domain-containing protein [Roseateles sp. DAIF2]|uniref:YybH family protein n=1 Tax=Roseateles sp. DAIF2 TaxID=2714952 RepID=UPI0018A2C6C6|nr:DUF4440 domain-containing protein [Roseateles sp. DAIF2]QPF73454.1 DUF4440 domain-containing protein [Roseateles sp. DAIF2]
MTRRLSLLPLLLASVSLAQAGEPANEAQQSRWQREVRAAECGFAASMARRDLAAFEQHLAEATLFFDGRGQPIQGRAAVVAAWKGFYEGAEAPFSWEPDQIVVAGDGQLAYSTGPVRNAKGEPVARFNSVWRQEAPGRWRIAIDRGAPLPAADRQALAPAGRGCEGLAPP